MWRGRWACCRDAKKPLTASPPSDDATERSRRMASTTGAAAVCSDADGGTGAGFSPSRKSHCGSLGFIALLLGVSCMGVDDSPHPDILAIVSVTQSGFIAHNISQSLIF